MKIRVEAEVYPTESRDRVIIAVKNLFPSLSLRIEALGDMEIVLGEGDDLSILENLKNMLRMRKIRAAAKSILKQSIVNGRIIFYMNKQAAFAGQASFTEPFIESPLPPIKVEVEAEDLDKIIEWLTE
ncbi:MAG: RNA-binding domain-containing protein [Candidatus Caldarchaeales archaeon]